MPRGCLPAESQRRRPQLQARPLGVWSGRTGCPAAPSSFASSDSDLIVRRFLVTGRQQVERGRPRGRVLVLDLEVTVGAVAAGVLLSAGRPDRHPLAGLEVRLAPQLQLL